MKQEMEDSIEQRVVNGFLMVELSNSKALRSRLAGYTTFARKGRQDFYLGHDGGYMIPIYSKIGQGMRNHFEKLVNWYGKDEPIPVYLENNNFNFYPNREVKSTETNNVNNGQQSGKEYGRAVRS